MSGGTEERHRGQAGGRLSPPRRFGGGSGSGSAVCDVAAVREFLPSAFKLARRLVIARGLTRPIIPRPPRISGCWRIRGPAKRCGAERPRPRHLDPVPLLQTI